MALPAQTPQKYPSAQATDPVKMGWMRGFPPPKDKVITAENNDFLDFPKSRWSFVHMRQLLPTVAVSRGLEAPRPLPYNLDEANIDNITFTPWDAKEEMTWEASLWKNYTDGIVILHRGHVVYERYFGALQPNRVHAVMSVSKSFTGTLASMLVAEGKLDPNKPVTDYVPELKSSAFGDATVRDVMDMTTALKYSEDYADPEAEVWKFSAAGQPVHAQDYKGPVGYYAYLQTMQKDGEHGKAFSYETPNADALGWIVSRVSGTSIEALLSERIWQKLGMEQSGYYQVDALGTPFAGGGLSAGLRDLARFGELMRNGGRWHGEQIIPATAVADIANGGSKEAFAQSHYTKLKGWSYRNLWWITGNDHGAYAARGVFGQTIYIDPKAEMVLVRLASYPVAANAANDPHSLPAYAAVAAYLLQKK